MKDIRRCDLAVLEGKPKVNRSRFGKLQNSSCKFLLVMEATQRTRPLYGAK